MSTTKPIKDKKTLESIKNYYFTLENYRNHSLIILGLNTALRISDILDLRWENVYDYTNHCFKKHLCLYEKKTKKESIIALNQASIDSLELWLETYTCKGFFPQKEDFIFSSRNHTNLPISRSQAYRIVQEAALACGHTERISCHSLRKTFGYYAWKQGASPVMLMNIYNHSSFQITKRYLGIDQDERDEIFLNIRI